MPFNQTIETSGKHFFCALPIGHSAPRIFTEYLAAAANLTAIATFIIRRSVLPIKVVFYERAAPQR